MPIHSGSVRDAEVVGSNPAVPTTETPGQGSVNRALIGPHLSAKGFGVVDYENSGHRIGVNLRVSGFLIRQISTTPMA
jgi:hypothetical protein